MKILLGLTLALLASAGIVYACADNEVWQPDISYENQCTEYKQVWSKNNGFQPLLGKWGCENFWHGTWFQNQCHLSGHVINTCVAYEQIEVDNGQCVAVEEDDDEGDDSGDNGGDTGGDTGGDGERNGENETETGQDGEGSKTSSNASGTSLWTRLSNVSGIKYTRENISLQEGLKLYDQIMADKRAHWDYIQSIK